MVRRLRYDHLLSIASPLLNPYSLVLFDDFSSKKHSIRLCHSNICLPVAADTNWLGSPEFSLFSHADHKISSKKKHNSRRVKCLFNCFFIVFMLLFLLHCFSIFVRFTDFIFQKNSCLFSEFYAPKRSVKRIGRTFLPKTHTTIKSGFGLNTDSNKSTARNRNVIGGSC